MKDRERPTKRLQVEITEADRIAIEDFQFRNRISNKSEAVRLLLMAGIAAEKDKPPRKY